MAAVKQDRSKGKVNEKITKNQPQVCWPRECAESAHIYYSIPSAIVLSLH